MNSNQVNQLKTVLRKYGNKNSESIVKQETGMKYSQFLEFAEPIYVISRIQSCYKDQRMISLLNRANLEWVATVVDNGWCTPLLPWIEKYGAEITKMSIVYLIEHDLWDTYRKTDYLRTKATDHYKGFNAIDEAAAYIKDQGKIETQDPKTVEEVEEPAVESDHPASAYDACERISKKMDSIKEELYTITEYIVNNSDNDEYRKAMDELKAKLEQANETIDKQRAELEAKRDEINNLQLMVAERNDEITDMQNKVNAIEIEYRRLKNSVDIKDERSMKMQKEIDSLREQLNAKGEDKPKKKVIPESGLRELPLVGDKMLRGLAPFLEKYNIIIDSKK